MTMSVRAAGFIVFRHANSLIEYLLLQASYGSFHWSPPKGHVDPGESDIETAWRETKEEAGLTKKALTVIPDFERTLTYQVGTTNKTVIYWLAKLNNFDEQIKLSKEHTTFKWATIEEATRLVEHEDIKGLLREVHEYLLKKEVNQ